jgi:hypothetical protein
MLELTPQQLNSYLRAGLACSATPWEETPGLLRRAFGWHLHLVQRGFEHIPCFLALDLAMALTRGPSARMRSEREYARWPEEERGVRLRYERELLYRVSTHQGLRPLFEVESAVSDAMLLHALCLICGGLEAAWPRLISSTRSQRPSRARTPSPSHPMSAPGLRLTSALTWGRARGSSRSSRRCSTPSRPPRRGARAS